VATRRGARKRAGSADQRRSGAPSRASASSQEAPRAFHPATPCAQCTTPIAIESSPNGTGRGITDSSLFELLVAIAIEALQADDR
jgi:hypothetical protein